MARAESGAVARHKAAGPARVTLWDLQCLPRVTCAKRAAVWRRTGEEDQNGVRRSLRKMLSRFRNEMMVCRDRQDVEK